MKLQTYKKSILKSFLNEVKRLVNFYPAESYHQDYLDKNKNGYCHIPPQLFEYAQNANANRRLNVWRGELSGSNECFLQFTDFCEQFR